MHLAPEQLLTSPIRTIRSWSSPTLAINSQVQHRCTCRGIRDRRIDPRERLVGYGDCSPLLGEG